MINLEIEKKIGGWLSQRDARDKIETTSLQIPATDGVHDTAVGPIALRILERDIHGQLQTIHLKSEVLRGSSIKHRQKRTDEKTVNLRNGRGAQALSKRERVIVRP